MEGLMPVGTMLIPPRGVHDVVGLISLNRQALEREMSPIEQKRSKCCE